jgi:hypothetical protein
MIASDQLIAEWECRGACRSVSISTAGEAIDLFLGIIKERLMPPAILEVYDPASGLSLGVGVDQLKSIVTFQEGVDPPYYIGLGSGDSRETIEFAYGGELSEYLGRNVVSSDVAIEALRRFVSERKMPDNLNWEEL